MRPLLILTFLFAVSVPPVAAQTTDVTGEAFSAIEKKIIEDFFGEQAADAVSGGNKNKGKIGELPPGLQMQLEKNGRLPPGLAKKELPPGLAKRLGSTRTGLERLIIDDDVLLVEEATGIVYDIIKDVVTGSGN